MCCTCALDASLSRHVQRYVRHQNCHVAQPASMSMCLSACCTSLHLLVPGSFEDQAFKRFLCVYTAIHECMPCHGLAAAGLGKAALHGCIEMACAMAKLNLYHTYMYRE